MPLRSHNILALLNQILLETEKKTLVQDTSAFQQMVGTETPWAHVFETIDSIPDFSKRQKLRALEFEYTYAYIRSQLQLVYPRRNDDIWCLERTSYLTGLFSDPYNLWDEYCAALDALEDDARQELDNRPLTRKKRRGKMADLEFMQEALAALNEAFFQKAGLRGDEDALNHIESYSTQIVLCERTPGIPLSLCVLYLIIGTRLGFPLFGVNTPGKFLVKWHYDNLEMFIDVFNKGAYVTRTDLEVLYSTRYNVYTPRFLEPTPFEVIARRLLGNLVALALRDEDDDRARKLEDLTRSMFGI